MTCKACKYLNFILFIYTGIAVKAPSRVTYLRVGFEVDGLAKVIPPRRPYHYYGALFSQRGCRKLDNGSKAIRWELASSK